MENLSSVLEYILNSSVSIWAILASVVCIIIVIWIIKLNSKKPRLVPKVTYRQPESPHAFGEVVKLVGTDTNFGVFVQDQLAATVSFIPLKDLTPGDQAYEIFYTGQYGHQCRSPYGMEPIDIRVVEERTNRTTVFIYSLGKVVAQMVSRNRVLTIWNIGENRICTEALIKVAAALRYAEVIYM
jgi:hypothetical protein